MSLAERPAIAPRPLSFVPRSGLVTWCQGEAAAPALGCPERRCSGLAPARPELTADTPAGAGAGAVPPNSGAIGATCLASQLCARHRRLNACWIVESSE